MERAFTGNSFGQFLNEEKLMCTKCKSCGTMYLPPRPICTKCHGTDMEWVESKGKGKIFAFTSIFRRPDIYIDRM